MKLNKKHFILFLGFAMLIVVSFGYFILQNSLNKKEAANTSELSINPRTLVAQTDDNATRSAREVAKEIEEVHCKTTEDDLINKEKLTQDDIKKVRDFCNLSADEKEKILTDDFRKSKEKSGNNKSKIASRQNSYSCWYALTYNWGIPNYADLGLSSSSCSWHDAQSLACKNEGAVACLWGCNNIDPLLGWHEKYFTSITALENEILPKAYVKINDYEGGSYGRAIGYGYRWQVHSIGGGRWHSEGPEPNPAFNWYAYLRGWWWLEVYDWHYNAC